MAHPRDSLLALHWGDEPELMHGELCPECGRYLQRLDEARACWWCGYYRPAPAPGAAVLGILGRGQYQRLRPRLIHMVRGLQVGLVVGQTINSELAYALALELRVNATTLLEHWKVIDEGTHLLFLGQWAYEILARARATGKPVRVIETGRFLAPPGGWPKRPRREPEPPALTAEELAAIEAEILEEETFPMPLKVGAMDATFGAGRFRRSGKTRRGK